MRHAGLLEHRAFGLPASAAVEALGAGLRVQHQLAQAPFAAGLLIYWTWNNVLSILQQYVIMHRFKAENPIDDFIAKVKARSASNKA